jgi:hypothetical protein
VNARPSSDTAAYAVTDLASVMNQQLVHDLALDLRRQAGAGATLAFCGTTVIEEGEEPTEIPYWSN